MSSKKILLGIATAISFLFCMASFESICPDRPESPDMVYQTTPGFWSYVVLLVLISATVYLGYKTKKAE